MERLEKKGIARLYTIEYAKMGHCYIHQFVAYTYGELTFFSHEFLEQEKPWAILSMNFQQVSLADYDTGVVGLFHSLKD